ncbi:MAG: hypothetical protein AAGK74_21960, partial [Chloroflexota bacterium]
PVTLQPFFKEQIDLNQELVQRFPTMPLMSVIRFRDIYEDHERGVATMTSQDGTAGLIVDVSRTEYDIQFSFTYGSMLSLRFHLTELSDLDRKIWLDNLQNRVDDIAFLWGQSRWAKDYIICVPHKFYLSLLAFSPNKFEAAVRVTPQVAEKLFKWLHTFWDHKEDEPKDNSSADSSASNILSNW